MIFKRTEASFAAASLDCFWRRRRAGIFVGDLARVTANLPKSISWSGVISRLKSSGRSSEAASRMTRMVAQGIWCSRQMLEIIWDSISTASA